MACMSLSQRIQLEQGKRQPSEIKELNLDRSKAAAIEGLSEDFSNLESLSLANVGLESLSGLPKLQALRNLELSGNCISDGLESLVNCPNLVKLNLSANKIDSVEALTPLAKLSNLRSLDLTNCEVAAIENYRKTVFAALPNLKYLDGTDENNESEPESEEQDCIVANGANGGNDEEAAENDDEDDEHESDEDEEDEEEYGIEALQRSDDLEDDDEEDYAPGAEEEVESEDYEDDFDEDEEDDSVQDDGANLSGAGVTGPRRPGSKRPLEGVDDDDESSAAKQKPDVDASADE